MISLSRLGAVRRDLDSPYPRLGRRKGSYPRLHLRRARGPPGVATYKPLVLETWARASNFAHRAGVSDFFAHVLCLALLPAGKPMAPRRYSLGSTLPLYVRRSELAGRRGQARYESSDEGKAARFCLSIQGHAYSMRLTCR
jgi:hypothetical protein